MVVDSAVDERLGHVMQLHPLDRYVDFADVVRVCRMDRAQVASCLSIEERKEDTCCEHRNEGEQLLA